MKTKTNAFPTKKSIAAAKTIDDIPQNQIDDFISGAKDISTNPVPEVVINKKPKVIPIAVVSENVNDIASQVGRDATFEKNFKRQTYYVHVNLIERIEKLARKSTKGAKTKIINAALEAYLEKAN